MMRSHTRASNQDGFVLVYMAAGLTTLLLFSGLAVDSGRGYLVKAQLSKAVDGAALAAARNLNSGDPKGEAARVFKANFPKGYLGTDASDPTTAGDFFSSSVNAVTGVNTVRVKASTTLPTTFMSLGSTPSMLIGSQGEATRRMVDLSLVLDVSSSIGSRWGAVRDASRTFVKSFDEKNDRISLVFFGNGARVADAMPSTRGFNKTKVDDRHSKCSSRRQHEHGRGSVSWLGRSAIGARRSAVGAAHHRAVHRRRVQQCACRLFCGGRSCRERSGRGTSRTTAPIQTIRHTPIRISTGCTTQKRAQRVRHTA